MSEITQLIHHYLRHDKKFPHVYCPGCGHGIALGSLIRSVHGLEIPKDDVTIVAGIGCSGRMAVYVDFNTVHAVHGRAIPIASGIKMCNPKQHVIVITGDGDAMSIGGNHFIHAARRNIGLTVLVLNNAIYGMTGGQCSATTPQASWTSTSPYGSLEEPLDIVNMASAAGANYVARGTVFHVKALDKMITEAIQHPGLSVVEVLTPCHTQYGRKNSYKTPIAMYEWLKKNAISKERYEALDPEKAKEKIPTGVFCEHGKPSYEERYQELRKNLARS
ncbi:2-oxoacid:ferredoxin oxidoreductase subunit beta [Desulfobaculum bizertense]|uniref:2-oxoglutarate ferredoxin oxidoreductase subunit beta n=1 Tax=Desulfobaculum bizertense DSM 18034 TaxID=1121442 RepID=A0A1T4VXK9_9BACT|nr:2-oxoacid:ferredoxin oxidoreductase subunit beta [Desulfobaculum bizertense]UIJ36943.1 2-oxoacid:ferredoxin oxidoreductase subunit beta [Desulfobaculum bizertense]SKA69736.1 2-oxoglutarate ferredoxin oxidoreductase subunit beta [Desulfobaculum bizertense DSM 18034]